ncbi:MAG: sulfatase-like hydrolase/transferase [Prevotella sp.]|nr:sulfatase-like hydrolase/transferase [Prevotella sp.]
MKWWMNKPWAPIVATAWNLLLVYLVYQIARCEYYFENASYLSYTSDVFRGGLLFDTSAIIYTNALYILLMLLPFRQNGYQQFCKWLYLIINGIALAMNLADSVYFQYTMRRTTTTVFSEFSNEGNLGSIIGTEFIHHWYLVLLFVGIMWLLWRLYAMPKKQHPLNMASLILVVPLCIAGIRGGFTTAVRPITISNANQYAQRPTDAALVLNTPFSMIRTIGKNVFVVPHYFESEAEMEAIYTPVHHSLSPPPSPLTSKNVVVLIVESFGREYIGALNKDLEGGRYKGYTPFTDSLISKSITFRYSFCNGRKSIDGMPSILSSIPMFVEPFFLTPASMNDYTGLAGILATEGYETAFFHGAQNGSMGFQAFAQKTGFQKYYGRTEYEAAHGTADFDGTWAIWDEPFMQYYAEEMSKMKQPFMTALFTASSHHPFVIPEKYAKDFPEGTLPIHKCIRYTDMAIRKFFETVQKQPWFANTIFVMTSDHTNQSDHAEYQTDLGGFCSPIIIYDPSASGGIQDKIAQQIDILPTVLGLLGYPKKYLGFGIDVLNTPAEDTWAVNYLNGIYQYVKYGYVLQFDGTNTKAIYSLDDRLMKNNLKGKIEVQPQMERELKAIIQQYMERMSQNRLMP